MKNYYKLLELDPEASDEVIQKAYRTLARKHHPDQYHSTNKAYSSEHMKNLNEAYTTLSNPSRRRRYDAQFQSFKNSRKTIDGKVAVEKIKNIAFWATLTLVIIGAFSSFARIFFLTPVGRIILVVAMGFLFFKFRNFRKKRAKA